jgi:hypothetical protein
VLEELSAIDALAAVRFASVFRDFSSPSDYEAFFAEIAADDSHQDSELDGPDADAAAGGGADEPEERPEPSVEGTVRSLRAGR